jgi:hypothetical protein
MVIFFLWIVEVPRRRPPPHTDVENEDISFSEGFGWSGSQ